jgi:hypothetical protein
MMVACSRLLMITASAPIAFTAPPMVLAANMQVDAFLRRVRGFQSLQHLALEGIGAGRILGRGGHRNTREQEGKGQQAGHRGIRAGWAGPEGAGGSPEG